MAKETRNERAEAVAEAVSKTELVLTKYKNVILIALAAIVLVGAGLFLYYKYAYQPKKAEALGQMSLAEASFRAEEYDLALNGDGNAPGFLQIIDEYGNKAGRAVHFYAGVCELQLGNYEQAVKHLKAYKGKDAILAARALACTGDAYVALGENEKALGYFVKAADRADNIYAAAYLLKAGVVCEELGKNADALVYYRRIKENYPNSIEGYDIDKYISRIESK